ncbi:sugar phosphate isomerase/epimerase family protein [Occultella kanbiaonis]|uniref:sugar phosphate isomerase/epimerase family protein n=1 Tax=Occultella kanbiaonis TaxID=2675754 RepID=UPI0013D28FB9|nr:sugar phosphate isomerase/epimerase family protein [Occultella kanbiaonis]
MTQHGHAAVAPADHQAGVLSRDRVTWSVFAKPWADLSGAQLGSLVSEIGFAGVEIPVRPNSFVTPQRVEARLPEFVAQLNDSGVVPISVAADLTEPTFAACQASGVPTIRVMAPIEADGYIASVARFRAQLQQSARWARQYGVKVGVQPHHGRYVASTAQVLDLLDGLPHADFTLIWDAAHDALAGDDPTLTLEIAAPRLDIVNLKNAVYRQLPSEPGHESAGRTRTQWRSWFMEGADGLSDWSTVMTQLRARNYAGPVCLSAQYTEPDGPLIEVVARDLALARRLYESAAAPA